MKEWEYVGKYGGESRQWGMYKTDSGCNCSVTDGYINFQFWLFSTMEKSVQKFVKLCAEHQLL